MSKRSLGRGLDVLMDAPAKTAVRHETSRPLSAHSPGLRQFLHRREPALAEKTAPASVTETKSAVSLGVVRMALVVADVALVALACLLMTQTAAPGWKEYTASIAALTLGCWLGVLAVLLEGEAKSGR